MPAVDHAENVRRFIEAFNRGDLATMLGLCWPNVEWKSELIGTPTYRGHEGMAELLDDVAASWSQLRTQLETIEVVDDVLLVEVRYSARGRTTGATVDGRAFYLVHTRDGKIRRVDGYANEADAREAMVRRRAARP